MAGAGRGSSSHPAVPRPAAFPAILSFCQEMAPELQFKQSHRARGLTSKGELAGKKVGAGKKAGTGKKGKDTYTKKTVFALSGLCNAIKAHFSTARRLQSYTLSLHSNPSFDTWGKKIQLARLKYSKKASHLGASKAQIQTA